MRRSIVALLGATCLGIVAADAQDATWLLNPGSADFNTDANWTPATAPTGTATFGASNTTTLTFSAGTTVDTFQFNAGAPAYTFNLSGQSLKFTGAGIVNNSANAPTFNTGGLLQFDNLATAGNAIINNTPGATTFTGFSTAGTATITNSGGAMSMFGGTLVNGTLNSTTYALGSGFISATLTGGAVTQDGVGTTLAAANTYAGDTTINSGTLTILNGGSLSTGDVTMNGGTLRAGASVSIANNVTLSSATTNTIAAASGTTFTHAGTIDFQSDSVTTFGSPTDTGKVVVAAGSSSASGTASVIVAGGTLQAGSNELGFVLDTTQSTTVNAGAALDFNDNFAAIRNLQGAGSVIIGANPASTLFLTVDPATTSEFAGVISGAGGVNVAGGGKMILSGDNTYLGGTAICSCTILQLGNGGTTGSIKGDVINGGILAFNRSDTYTFSGAISDDGPDAGQVMQIGTGKTILTGANTYTGATTVAAGTLQVDGSLGATAVSVASGATLRGAGSIGGGVTVQNGGNLAGASGSTLTMGSLVLNASSNVNVALGAPNSTRLFNVLGNLTLAGTLNITDAGGYGTGVYRLFDYGGTLANNGLAVGSSPPRFTTSINTATAQQVNLNVLGVPGATQFWQGGSTPVGGSGVWNASNVNWTDADGTHAAPWNRKQGIFQGTPGTVTVAGAQPFTSLEFVVNGYTLLPGSGGALAPTGTAQLWTEGANTTAVIATPITGSGGIDKIGAGTIILSGVNTYSGGTVIDAGTLVVSEDTNLGAAAGGITFNGGKLQAFASFSSSRAITLNANGGTIDTNGYGVDLRGNIAGDGGLTKTGAGTLQLSGASTYTGATVVDAGTLVAGTANAFSANSAFTVASDATLSLNNFDQVIASLAGAGNVALVSGTLTTGGNNSSTTFSGAFSGMGGLVKNGTGNFTLPSPAPETPPAPVVVPPPNSLPTNGLNRNQRNVAVTIDNFFNTNGGIGGGFTSLFNLSAASVPAAMTLLSGEAATGAATAGFRLGDQYLELMLDPFADGRTYQGAHGPALAAPENKATSAYAAMVTKAPRVVPSEQPWTVWGAPFGGESHFDGNPVVGSNNITARDFGFAAGADYRVTRDSVVGFSLAGGGTSFSLAHALGSGNGESFLAGAYASTRINNLYMSVAGDFIRHDFSTARNVALPGLFDRLTADFHANQLGARFESGYRMTWNDFGVTPYGALQGQTVHTPLYSERDATGLSAFALAYNRRDVDEARSELGARFDRRFALAGWGQDVMLLLRGRLAWAHEFANDNSINATFITLPGSSPFSVTGALPTRKAALTTAGMEFRLANGTSLIGKFDGQFSDHGHIYAGSATLRMPW